jgi:hypothetical protein
MSSEFHVRPTGYAETQQRQQAREEYRPQYIPEYEDQATYQQKVKAAEAISELQLSQKEMLTSQVA